MTIPLVITQLLDSLFSEAGDHRESRTSSDSPPRDSPGPRAGSLRTEQGHMIFRQTSKTPQMSYLFQVPLTHFTFRHWSLSIDGKPKYNPSKTTPARGLLRYLDTEFDPQCWLVRLDTPAKLKVLFDGLFVFHQQDLMYRFLFSLVGAHVPQFDVGCLRVITPMKNVAYVRSRMTLLANFKLTSIDVRGVFCSKKKNDIARSHRTRG